MDAIRLLRTPGATPESSNEEIERLLSCPICLEVYSKPVVILPCQHNLCRSCAQDMFQSRGTSLAGGGRFRCPTCRYEVLLDRHGVFGLQRNLLVENIVDMYNASQNTKPIVTYKPPEEIIMCDEHPEEKVNIYCVTCQKVLCSLCKIFGAHVNCEVSTLPEMHTTLKVELSDSIAKLVCTNDQLEAAHCQTDDLGKVTEMNGNAVKNSINAAFDKLQGILNQRKQVMLSIISKELKKKKEYSERVKSGLKGKQTLSSDIMDGALQLLEVRNSALFLDQARGLISKIEENLEVNYDNDTCMDLKDMSKFEIDFREEEEVLNNIHFVSMKNINNDIPSSSSDLPPLRPWETCDDDDEEDESEEEEEEEEEEEPQQETNTEENGGNENEGGDEQRQDNNDSSSDSSDSDSDSDSSPYMRHRRPWRSGGISTPLTTSSLRSSLRSTSPVTRRTNEASTRRVIDYGDSDSDDASTPNVRFSLGESTSKPKPSSIRVKIDPPKPFEYKPPSYKPKRPVRFANLLPLSDSDNDMDNYSTSRRARLALTSRYGSFGDSLSPSSANAAASSSTSSTAHTSSITDAMLDPPLRTDSASPSNGSDAGSEHRRRAREYCTHKRRTWSHLLDKKP